MNWIGFVFLFVLALQVSGRQDIDESGLRLSLAQKMVRLDPLLRRALLRALTDLEKEAQAKVEKEEILKLRSDIKAMGKRENTEADASSDEIQDTADTSYSTPRSNRRPNFEEEVTTTEASFPVTVKEAFLFHTPESIETEPTQETGRPDPTLTPPDIESNLISETKIESSEKPAESSEEKEVSKDDKKSQKEHEVELFQAPLVAAFTLHQDSKGVPHSVIPLIRTSDPLHRQKLLQQQQQQLALLKHQEQQLLQQRQQLLQQASQQFIPSVTITPNSFGSTGFPSSTPFPPLVSNSLQNFQSTVIPSQSFHVSSTVAPARNSFPTTPSPPRNFSPQVSTLHPQSEFSVVPSHAFNLSPTPQPALPSVTSQVIQPLNIPPVTLPLQNEPRFPFQPNQNQQFERQKQIEDLNRQRQLEEYNRLRFLEEQNRQRQIEEQNRQRQIEEQNRQRQIEEQRRLEEQKRLRQLEEERKNQFRQQRQEQGIDFQRSVGFTFNTNPKPAFNFLPNSYNFLFQPSQSFPPPLQFQDLETRNRVNRQEAFGSTGNFGFNRPLNQIPQFQKDVQQRGFQNNQFQQFNNFQPYRTIPEEHYRGLRFQQNNVFPTPSNYQFRQFRQPTPQPVTKQLENLLIQSGVATGDASRQEDLNIVSKVLALNHERSDIGVNDRESIRNERRAPDTVRTELLVGETSEAPSTTENASL